MSEAKPLMEEVREALRGLCSDDPPCVCDDWMVTPAGEKCVYCNARAALSRIEAEGESRNWTEDSEHENGDYFCNCCICKNVFTGHKRRVVCKLCHEKGTLTVANATLTAQLAAAREENARLRDFIERHTYVEYGGYKQSCVPHCIACGETTNAYGGEGHKGNCKLRAALTTESEAEDA